MNASSILPKISSVRNSILDQKQIIGTKLFSNYEQLSDTKPILRQSISSQMVNLFDVSYGQKNNAKKTHKKLRCKDKCDANCQTEDQSNYTSSTETQTELTSGGDWESRYNFVPTKELNDSVDNNYSYYTTYDYKAANDDSNSYLKTNSCVLVYNVNENKTLRDIVITKIDYIDNDQQIDEKCENSANGDELVKCYSNAYSQNNSELQKLINVAENKETQTSSENVKCLCCSIM